MMRKSFKRFAGASESDGLIRSRPAYGAVHRTPGMDGALLVDQRRIVVHNLWPIKSQKLIPFCGLLWHHCEHYDLVGEIDANLTLRRAYGIDWTNLKVKLILLLDCEHH